MKKKGQATKIITPIVRESFFSGVKIMTQQNKETKVPASN